MSARHQTGTSHRDNEADVFSLRVRAARFAEARRTVARCLIVTLAAASLAACAQTSMVRQSASLAPTRQASVERYRPTATWFAPNKPVTVATHHHSEPESSPAETHTASRGVASFYTEGTRTASGEQFDPNELTAAHPTLPFGTRLRVTNMSTGRSVMVRVNDRGPFVKGRVVDVSYSAARALGMVQSGVANVKVDVVQR